MKKQLAKIVWVVPFFSFFLATTVSFALDTDIYMGTGQGIEPNILVIFDNSGSMGEPVTLGPITYDPSETYLPQTYTRDAIYGMAQNCNQWDYNTCVQYGTSCDVYYTDDAHCATRYTDDSHCTQWYCDVYQCKTYQCQTYQCQTYQCQTYQCQTYQCRRWNNNHTVCLQYYNDDAHCVTRYTDDAHCQTRYTDDAHCQTRYTDDNHCQTRYTDDAHCATFYNDMNHCKTKHCTAYQCQTFQCKTYHCNQYACKNYTTQWSKVYNSISDVPCQTTQANLTGYGQSNTACNGVNSFRTGNYMNYIHATLNDQTNPKIEYTKSVIKNFINTAHGVKLGIMVFNYDQGGYIVKEVVSLTDANRADLIAAINGLTAQTWTPLAETLWEAGLYFKGAPSYFNSGTYTSPIQFACQKNYVIIITDGNSTQDQDPVLYNNLGPDSGYIASHYANNGSDYLDNVAQYLYNTDLMPTLDGTQNITTYTIGFSYDPSELGNGAYASDLLNRTAIAGGGKFFYADNAQSLADSFQNIVGAILEKTSMYVAPIVPVNQVERTSSGDKIYFALFKPNQYKMWSGNIKKFGIAQNDDASKGITVGDIIDAGGNRATDDVGEILDSAVSFWSSNADGSKVEMGGVGATMDPSKRKIYTYFSSSSDLTNNSNAFSKTNSQLTIAAGNPLGVTDDTAKNNVIDYVYGYDVYGSNPTQKRSWILGGFLHSRPAVIHYSNKTVIFAGANDGMFHAFDDDNGNELWAFIPPDLLGKLKDLDTSIPGSFVDGSPRTFVQRTSTGTITKAMVIFGERRGGNKYYALDVTDYSKPKIAWVIDPNAVGSPYAKMGQSWSTPTIGNVKIGGQETWVAFIGGGYDPNQDLSSPGSDSIGMVVYAVNVSDGSKAWEYSGNSNMTYSIPGDIAAVDTDGDGLIDRLYVGDMGGRMWRFDTNPGQTWGGSIFFDSSSGATPKRKIFYSPDITLAKSKDGTNYEILFFGTGNREQPSASLPANRLYSVDDFSNNTSALTESDLYDATSDDLQSSDPTKATQAQADLAAKKGWYIQLQQSGEKCLAPSNLLNGVVYYTTFTPTAPPQGTTDPCFVGEGTARLYALSYTTGNAAMNLDITNGDLIEKSDRSAIIGTSIPSGVAICIVNGKITGYVGVGMPSSDGYGAGGGGWKLTPKDSNPMRPEYWRMAF